MIFDNQESYLKIRSVHGLCSIYAKRDKGFGFDSEINGFLPGLSSFNSSSGLRQDAQKRGWQIMRRFIVLCLIVLSVLSFPGNASALLITGEVWQSALASASNPQSGPPSSMPDATFAVTEINFDSRRAANPGSISYDTFLNAVPGSWVINTTGFDPFAAMFSGTANPADKGIFFRFTTAIRYSPNDHVFT